MQPDEAWAHAILQSTSQAILAVGRDGRIVTANPAAEHMYRNGAGEMLQLPLERLMPERYRERHAAYFKQWFSQPRVRPMVAGDGFDLDQALKKGGLGVISMQERVRAMNGELAIDSKRGAGTVGTAFVPLSEGRGQCAAQS